MLVVLGFMAAEKRKFDAAASQLKLAYDKSKRESKHFLASMVPLGSCIAKYTHKELSGSDFTHVQNTSAMRSEVRKNVPFQCAPL